MPTKADNPEEENRTDKDAADSRTSITIESALTPPDTVGQSLRRDCGLNGVTTHEQRHRS